jgi:hypothetical protein
MLNCIWIRTVDIQANSIYAQKWAHLFLWANLVNNWAGPGSYCFCYKPQCTTFLQQWNTWCTQTGNRVIQKFFFFTVPISTFSSYCVSVTQNRCSVTGLLSILQWQCLLLSIGVGFWDQGRERCFYYCPIQQHRIFAWTFVVGGFQLFHMRDRFNR